MSTLGKGVTSIRKKDLNTQKSLGVGVKKTVFYHQATSGDTGINLLSLVLPSSIAAVGKTNPSASGIQAARLLFNQDNLTLFSSLRGWLMPSSFVVASSSQINFSGFTAADQEIFIGYIDNILQPSLHAANVNPINATGTLAVGTTDFAVSPFTVGLYPTTQLGSVLVFRNGKLQMRNVGNATASPGADGNYQEVSAGGSGTGSTIRFNIAPPGPNDDAIVVCANGALIEQPTDSQMAYIETLAGQIGTMIPYLADAAGVPTSTFGSNPSSVDLRTYGAQVISNTNLLAKAPTITTLTSGSGTYSPPSGVVYLKIRMVGGGGGGGGSGTSGGSGGTSGTATTFGTSFLVANGGGGGGVNSTIGAGGTASFGAGASGVAFTGGSGMGPPDNGVSAAMGGSSGGVSPFGGGGTNNFGIVGPAIPNTGSGGGGAGTASGNAVGGCGGGAGGYVDVIVAPVAGSYPYTIGTGGNGGSAGSSGNTGVPGASGIIIIEEHYSG